MTASATIAVSGSVGGSTLQAMGTLFASTNANGGSWTGLTSTTGLIFTVNGAAYPVVYTSSTDTAAQLVVDINKLNIPGVIASAIGTTTVVINGGQATTNYAPQRFAISGTDLTTLGLPTYSALLSTDQSATTNTLVITGSSTSVGATIAAINRTTPKGAQPTSSTKNNLVGTTLLTGALTLTWVDIWSYGGPTNGVASGYGQLASEGSLSSPNVPVGIHNNDTPQTTAPTGIATTMPADSLDLYVLLSDGSVVVPTLAGSSHTTIAVQPLIG